MTRCWATRASQRRLLFKPRCPLLPRLHRDVAAACLDGFDPTASQAEQYDCPQAQGLDLRWPLKAAGAGRFNRGLQAAAQLLTGALPWKAKSVSTSRWSQWPLTSDQCL